MTEKVHQYAGNDYIQPPISPPMLDAKKSPLALLAQTCSAIGKEPITIANPALQASKLPAVFHPNDLIHSPNNLYRKSSVVCGSPSSNLPRVPTASPALSEGKAEILRHDKSPQKSMASHIANWRTFSQMAKYGELSNLHSAEMERRKSIFAESRKRKGAASLEVSERKMSKLDIPYVRQQLSTSPVTQGRYSSELQHSASKASPAAANSLLSLYESYAMGCQAPHIGGAGCMNRLKSAPFPFHALGNPAGNAYPLYTQMLMSAARNPIGPIDSSQFVCNWVNPGSTTCGKRFATAEELSTHLRTHVTATPSTTGVNYFMNSLEKIANSQYAAAYLTQAAALAAVSPVPSAINHSILSRSHSPSNGYPYKANMLSQITSNLPPTLSIPVGVGPYISSPYGLYNSKLNPTAAGFCYQ